MGLGLARHGEGGGSAECFRRGDPTPDPNSDPNSDPKGDPNPNPNLTGGVFPGNEVFLLG